MSVTLYSVMTPSETDAISWDLDYSGWRAVTPDSYVTHYGHLSTASAGWEEHEFDSWSDSNTDPIDPDLDPHLEAVFNMPSIWDTLSTYTMRPYTVTSFALNISLCIDDGCSVPLPGESIYDDSNAKFVMPEQAISAVPVNKAKVAASDTMGPAGQALLDSLRSSGQTDAQIENQYPGLIGQQEQVVIPDIVINAYLNEIEYVVYDDDDFIVSAENLVPFLESKGMPEQMVYEIVNGLPITPPASFLMADGGEGGGDDRWEDVKIKTTINGSVSATGSIGGNGVEVRAGFEVEIEGTAGQLANGGAEAAALAVQAAKDAVNEIVEEVEENKDGIPVTIKVALVAVDVVLWFQGLF